MYLVLRARQVIIIAGDSGPCCCVPCYMRDVSQAQLVPFICGWVREWFAQMLDVLSPCMLRLVSLFQIHLIGITIWEVACQEKVSIFPLKVCIVSYDYALVLFPI